MAQTQLDPLSNPPHFKSKNKIQNKKQGTSNWPTETQLMDYRRIPFLSRNNLKGNKNSPGGLKGVTLIALHTQKCNALKQQRTLSSYHYFDFSHNLRPSLESIEEEIQPWAKPKVRGEGKSVCHKQCNLSTRTTACAAGASLINSHKSSTAYFSTAIHHTPSH